MVKIKIKIGENEYDSYVTKDGKYLFPQTPIDMSKTETSSSASGGTAEEVLASIQKSDNPAVEAYVVSRCPFGLQMQRMIAEAVKNISVLANNIKVKYIGSVSSDGKGIESMHGAEEAAENLRQICIREEQPAKYWNYVSCQMKAQGTELSCEKSTGVDSAKLSACLGDPGRGVAFAKKDFETADQLGISGSPTLAINGKVIDEFTSDNNPVFGSSRSADEMKTTVCIASNSQPDFCSTNLDTAQAATSFSETYGSSGGSNSSSCQ